MWDWKELARTIVECHNEHGGSCYCLDGENALLFQDQAQLVIDERHLSEALEGPEIGARRVRGYLWGRRRLRCMQRARTVVWSAYDAEGDASYLGLAHLVPDQIASRLTRVSPHMEFPEVIHG